MKLFNYFSKNIGIDLGTVNILVYVNGQGIIINEPSIAAVNKKTSQVLAIGQEAKKMLGRTPGHIEVVKPLTNGVISDFEMAQEIIRHYLKKAGGNKFFNYYSVVIGVPSNLTEVEKKSVEDAAISAGAARVYLIEEPVAAALGGRLPIYEPVSNMIIDIGGGTAEVAIISMGASVVSRSLKIAGEKLNEDIIDFIRDEFQLLIGEPTAEILKTNIGSALPLSEKLEMAIRGRDQASGLPKEIIVRDSDIRAAITPSLKIIIEAIADTIEKAPPELVGDILKQGIYLCGGGSLLRNFGRLIEAKIQVKTTIIDDPLTCVARGTGIAAENLGTHFGLFNVSWKPPGGMIK